MKVLGGARMAGAARAQGIGFAIPANLALGELPGS
jgi:hypothetical protein